jgi:NADH:ubiquinone oxidoreductase subunit K
MWGGFPGCLFLSLPVLFLSNVILFLCFKYYQHTVDSQIFFFFFFAVLGLELRAYTLHHSTSPFL